MSKIFITADTDPNFGDVLRKLVLFDRAQVSVELKAVSIRETLRQILAYGPAIVVTGDRLIVERLVWLDSQAKIIFVNTSGSDVIEKLWVKARGLEEFAKSKDQVFEII